MPVDGVKLAVGQVWRRRDGQVTAALYATDSDTYPFGDSTARATWTDNGVRDLGSNGLAHTDLVELVTDEHGFTIWRGGEPPVSDNTEVHVILRGGGQMKTQSGFLTWRKEDVARDIVAYKVLNASDVVDAESRKAEPITVGIDPGAPEGDQTVVMVFKAEPRGDDTPPPPPVNAIAVLEAAAGHMRDRAATYDKPEGERSMAQTVAAFNAITGRNLSEAEGWLVLDLLKLTRLFARAGFHRDSAEDHVAYAALLAEAKAREAVPGN